MIGFVKLILKFDTHQIYLFCLCRKAGNQIQHLANSVFKVEAQAAGIKIIVLKEPGTLDCLQLFAICHAF